jgi:hypothetical protein
MRMRESGNSIPSPFIHSCGIWKKFMHCAWYPHPHIIYPDTDKGALGPPVSQHGSTNR